MIRRCLAVMFHRRAVRFGAASAALVALFAGLFNVAPAHAFPGSHVPAISTFDTRGSTVVLAYREGFGDATFRTLSYNANFSATGGNFSAQFGAHYLQFRDVPGVNLAHGAGASGVGLFSFPLSDRFDNGVPKAAFDLYLGSTPTAAISGIRNFLTAPLVFGLGASLSPAHWLTLTPWAELSPSVNWDTYIDPEGVEFTQEAQILPNGDVQVNTSDVEAALREAVDSRLSFHVGARLGLSATAHLGESWDVNTYGQYVTLGSLFGGTPLVQVGGGLSFHWDEIVPAVLPARRRLNKESCEAVAERFMACPEYRVLTDRAARVCSATAAEARPVPCATPQPAPAPAAPVPPQPVAPPPEPLPAQPGPSAPVPAPVTPDAPLPPTDGPPQGSFPLLP